MALPVDEHFIHHCETQPDDEDGAEASMYAECTNDHTGFIPVAQFGQDDLPVEFQTDEKMAKIRNWIDRTVHISVAYTSKKRPDTFIDNETKYPFRDFRGSPRKRRHGTGFILEITNHVTYNHCICPECLKSDNPKTESWVVYVSTAAHVIYDTSEAKMAVVELFYDSDDRKGVVFLHGTYVMGNRTTRCYTDQCIMACVTHDRELVNRLKEMCSHKIESPSHPLTIAQMLNRDGVPGMLISHPHGISKRISLGKIHYCNMVLDRAAQSIVLPKGSLVKLPSADAQTKDMQDDGHGNYKDALKSDSISGSKQSTSQNSMNASLVGNSKLLLTIHAIPPKRAKFQCRCVFNTPTFNFPIGTKFITESGIEVFPFPPITEFTSPVDMDWEYVYLDHDITSCPGSSGAKIFDLSKTDIAGLHFGTDESKKLSGLSGTEGKEWFQHLLFLEDYDSDDSTINDCPSIGDADKKSATNKKILRNERMRRLLKRRAGNEMVKEELKKFVSRRTDLESITVTPVINALIKELDNGLYE